MTTETTADDRPVTAATWAGFGLMALGMFMAILDIQVVATSLPNITTALGVRSDQMVWIQTAYMIAEIIAIPLTGFLTRMLSMRWLFVIAVSVFTIASAGCASSNSFETLVAWRVLQGFSGGTLIPSVFSAALLLFPPRLEGLATTVAGVLAVLAPIVGPIVGGWITQTYSWHWLFLINVVPGVICALGCAAFLPKHPHDLTEARRLDGVSLILMAAGLAALEIGLKDAPHFGWLSIRVFGLLSFSTVAAALFVWRTLRATHPIVELRTLKDPPFAVGCLLSFLFGVAIFGQVYLMPVFLGLVREHNSLRIGEIMLVSGVAQLVMAPVTVGLEQRVNHRLLLAVGFLFLAIGLAMSGFATRETDFDGMFWPQLVRGLVMMLCVIPATRLALSHLPDAQVPDASGLFNMMRNLGGAIGLALIDTVIYSRSPVFAREIGARLERGDYDTAVAVGIPPELFAWRSAGPLTPEMQDQYGPMVERVALTHAINEAWLLLAGLTVLALVALPFARPRAKIGAS